MMDYERLFANLNDFVIEHELDEVSVYSLLQGAVEFIEPEMSAATIAVITPGDLSGIKSTKLKNIKINLKFALSTIFSLKPVLTAKGTWLILSILKTIVFLIEEATIKLGRDEATVLFVLYRMQAADEEKIEAYLKTLKIEENDIDIKDINVKTAIENLLRIGAVDIVDGQYVLRETILVKT